MKQFLQRVTAFLILIFCLLSALLFLYAPSDNHYLRGSEDKANMAEASDSPKICLIGDSNLAFGIRSETLEDSLKRPVVNTGLIGQLGLAFSIRQYEDYINQNDLAIVSLNYQQFNSELNGVHGKEKLAVLIAMYPKYARHLSSPQQITPVFKGGLEIAKSVLLQTFGSKKKQLNMGSYSRDLFNRHGDYIVESDHGRTFKFRVDGYLKPISEEYINDLNHYLVELQAKTKCKIVLISPPMPLSYKSKIAPHLASLYEQLNSALDFPIITQYEDYFFEDSLFYDTDMHLNKKGALMRTQRLIEALKKYKMGTTANP